MIDTTAAPRGTRLTAILRGVSGIERRIARERDGALGLREACALLVERGAYQAAWIADRPEAAAGVITAPLEHDGRRIGFLCAAPPERAAGEAEEIEMLGAVAAAIARALFEPEEEDAAPAAVDQLARIAASVPGAVATFVHRSDGSACMPLGTAAMQDVYGFPAEELARDALPVLGCIHPEDRPAVIDAIAASARDLSRCHLQHRYLHPKKGLVWLEVWSSPKRLPCGSIEWCGITMDVTEHKLTESLLRESEIRFRAIFEQAGVGVAHVDAQSGRLSVVNDTFCEILGYPREELVTLDWPTLTHPDDMADDLARAERLRSGAARTESCEKRYIRKDGSVVWVHLTVTRQDAGHGIAVIEDITARKQAEAALMEAQAALRALTADLERRVADRTAELDRAARAKDEFLASMSHELRTPLNGILGLSEALQEGIYGAVAPAQNRSLARIQESGRHLLSLINDILDVAKVEAGKLELEPRLLDVGEVCRASLRLVQEPAQKKGIRVGLGLDLGVRRIVADERRLKQVLVNLLTNAVKFTPENGAAGVDVTGGEGGDTVHITVWDEGIGIAAADIPRLFQPFVQLDSRLSRQHAGTGLGLALVRRLVKLHGGEVTVESEIGRGTRFTVILPVGAVTAPADAAPARESESPPEPGAPRRGHLVLLADDDETNLVTFRDYLEKNGLEVRVARDGEEAVKLARALRPDVILMDVQMPGLDGLAATRAVRAQAELGGTPIIALTALAMPGDRDRCLAAGADDYLAKPVKLAALLAAVHRQLAARAPRR